MELWSQKKCQKPFSTELLIKLHCHAVLKADKVTKEASNIPQVIASARHPNCILLQQGFCEHMLI